MSTKALKNRSKVVSDIIEIKLDVIQTPETLSELKKQITEWSKDHRHDVIVDASQSGMGSLKTREAAEKFFAGLPYRRFAIFGGIPPVNLSIKNLVERHADGEHVKIFRKEEDARSWLAENNHVKVIGEQLKKAISKLPIPNGQ